MEHKENIDFNKIMKSSYLDYAEEVITNRALPDVRDGLKPVHRRILYAMYDLGMYPDKPYKKSARIVGEVLGKYHPHGDSSVYDALVRLAQDFSINSTLIDGHGNFGSIDGDGAAAMRYTEARMTNTSLQMLKDIDKGTVDFIDNFDGEEREPTVLPSRYPNLLVNGSTGIAVGMATNIPPHNFEDSIECTVEYINQKIKNDFNEDKLIDIIKAPDFPTGNVITNPEDMSNLYKIGEGIITLRSNYHIQINKKNKEIIITDVVYQNNKEEVISSIINLIKQEKSLNDIIDIKDSSDKDSIKIVITVKSSANLDLIMGLLFKKTKLQKNISAKMIALVNGEPKVLSLKGMLEHYVKFQEQIITRRTQFDLNKSLVRLHLLEGLKLALLNIDEVIALIKQSKNVADAKDKLMNKLHIDDTQATGILNLKLQRLTNLEITTLEEEYNNLIILTKSLNEILNDNDKLLRVLIDELSETKNKYGRIRKTSLVIEDKIKSLTQEDLVTDNSVSLVLTKEQYLKKNLKFSDTHKLKEGDIILQNFTTTNKTDLLMFTSNNRVFTRHTYDIQECTPSALGDYLPNLLNGYLDKDETVIYITTTNDYKGDICCLYENGMVSKAKLSAYKTKTNRMTAMSGYTNKNGKLIDIKLLTNDCNIIMISNEGKVLIIDSGQVNSKASRDNGGSKGMSLKDDFRVIGGVINYNDNLKFTITTEKDKTRDYILDDVADNSDKSWNEYLKGNRAREGNFIWNSRQKKDEIVRVEFNE